MRSRFLNVALILIVFVLGALLLRENQRANAADAKLEDIQTRVAAANDENQNLINELQYEITTLKGKLEEEKELHKNYVAEKTGEIQKMNEESKAREEQHAASLQDKDSEISQLEDQAKADKDKFDGLLKDKNQQIQDLSRKLEEASARQVELVSKVQAVEAKNLDNESKINELQRQITKLNNENTRLNAALTASAEHPAALD